MSNLENNLKLGLSSIVNNSEPSEKIKENIFKTLDSKAKAHKAHISYKVSVRVAAAAVCFAFVFSVNVSPTFAGYLGKFPLISGLVELVKFDKGLEEIMQNDKGVRNAVDSGYGKNVGFSVSDNGISFTVENVIADNNRMLITYSIKHDTAKYGEISSLWFENLSIKGEGSLLAEIKNGFLTDYYLNGDFIANNIVGPGELGKNVPFLTSDAKNNTDKLYGYMEINKNNTAATFPSKLEITIDGLRSSVSKDAKIFPGNWKLSVVIPEEYLNTEPQTYTGENFNLAIENYNLDMKLDYVKIYPTVTSLKMTVADFHQSPTRFFLKMYLEDEEGNIYRQTKEGLSNDPNLVLQDFESCYFNKPQNLTLVIESIVKPGIKDPSKNEIPLNMRIKIF